MKPFSIASRPIGSDSPPYLIAEMSGNHNQSLERALELVDAAADSGADAIKLQTYRADTMAINVDKEEFRINNPDSLWDKSKLYDLYEKAHTPWEWHPYIFERAKKNGIDCFSSPFDETAVDFLEKLDAPAYKIASFENTHIPLIKKVAQTQKPIIISTGMASIAELANAVTAVRSCGNENLILLKCTSSYPASPENSNLRTISHLNHLFNVQVGLSDHTLGIGAAVASVTLGATIIEKHFTLSRDDGGVDSAFSLEPSEFKFLRSETLSAWQSLGHIHYGPTSQELDSKKFRRSIYAKRNISVGEVFSTDNIGIFRPEGGASPIYFEDIIGRRSKVQFSVGDPITLAKLWI